MSALDAFMSTWNNAHATFGQGTPDDGAQIDKSAQLRQMQGRVESAAPGSTWTGSASDSYGDANAKHGRMFGELAGLDKKLATEVGNSAAVVAAGRRDLDAVKQWVVDAAATVPNTKDRDKMLWPIVNKGSGEIADIITRSNGDLSAIGGRIQGIGGEYQALGDDAKKGAGDDPDKDKGADKDGDEKKPVDPGQAEHDVHQTLAGQATPEELARVRNNLTLTPQQQADYDAGRKVQLDPQQQQVLGQMQAQTHSMSIDDIRKAEQRLGPADDHLVSDSLQMMSSDKIDYARVLPEPAALGSTTETSTGGVHGLPDSVQKALSKDYDFYDRNFDKVDTATKNAHDVATLADIVRDGDPKYQHGTGLDQRMLDWSSDTLQHDVNAGPTDTGFPFGSAHDEYVAAREDALDKVFYAAGQDHIAVGNEMQGDSGQQFLDGLHSYEWQDPSHSGSSHALLDWIGTDGVSSDVPTATNAGQAAHSLATYLDTHSQQLLNHDGMLGHDTIGNYDPALVSADATALAPFQRAMIGDLTGTHGFDSFGDPGGGDYSHARNVFAVIDSDPTAAKMFNGVAEQNILNYQNSFADAAAHDPEFNGSSPHYTDMQNAANMLGVVNGGADAEATQRGLNQDERNQAIYDIKKNALDFVVSGGTSLVPGLDKVPGLSLASETAQAGILGDTPAHVEASHNAPTYNWEKGRSMTEFQIASAMNVEPGIIDQKFFHDGDLIPPEQVTPVDLKTYNSQMQQYLNHHTQVGAALNDFYAQYQSGLTGGASDIDPPSK